MVAASIPGGPGPPKLRPSHWFAIALELAIIVLFMLPLSRGLEDEFQGVYPGIHLVYGVRMAIFCNS